MKAIKVLLGTLIFLSATCSWGETFQCEMYGDAVEKGWLPATFTMEYAPDLTEIISPVSPVFGTVDFEKGFLGSTLWARGKGKTKAGEFYNFEWQMDFKRRSGEMRLKMSMQGYRDTVGEGDCVGIGGQSTSLSREPDRSPSKIKSRNVIQAKASTGAKATFSEERIVIQIGSAERLRERVQKTRNEFGSYEDIKVTEIVVQRPTSGKGYGSYDWLNADSVNAVVNFSANEIEIIADKSVLIDALRHLNKADSVQIGVNTGRGWMTTVFYKKKGNWN